MNQLRNLGGGGGGHGRGIDAGAATVATVAMDEVLSTSTNPMWQLCESHTSTGAHGQQNALFDGDERFNNDAVRVSTCFCALKRA